MSMNKQHVPAGIEWTRINGTWNGYTWNPVGGCPHGCRWTMPNGDVANCYAKEVADRMRSDKFYAEGFDHHYWYPERLSEPSKIKEPSGIFVDSMSDLMASWVPAEQVQVVLDVCTANPQHVFQLLTKNAPRLKQFDFPKNVWVGVSSPPTTFMGKKLDLNQQGRYIHRALDVLRLVDVPVRWMSIEPLSFDITPIFQEWEMENTVSVPLEWAVVGAASNGKKIYQPEPQWVSSVVDHLHRNGTKVFFKGNLRDNIAAKPFLTEFPVF